MIGTMEKTTTTIRDLIIINNDRFEGYQKAANETKDADLKAMFTRFSSQSKMFNADLQKLIPDSETPKDSATSASGKLYRTWMDLKAAVTANDRKAILSSCEYGEDVALKAYKEALNDEDIPEDVRITLRKHKNELQEAHDSVKSLRDRT